MKLHRLLFFGLLIQVGILNAQTDFRPGFVINSTGDTLFGQIDYRGDLFMSLDCRFKDSENKINNYSPNDIMAFRFIDSKFYVSRELNGTKVFLECLIKGKISIYYMRDYNGDHYYLDKEEMQLTEMPYEEGIRSVNNTMEFYQSKKHIGILNYYMQDAPGFRPRIESIKKPDQQNLVKLAEDYNKAVSVGEKSTIYQKRLALINISIAPFIGIAKYSGYNKLIMEYAGYFYLWAPRTSEKLFFKTGLVYHKLSEDGLNLTVYKIPIQFLYMYRAHLLQPNVSGGVNLLSLNLNGIKDLAHTISLNAGLDYKLSDKVNLSTAFNSDFTTLSMIIMYDNVHFRLISYSIIVGLKINL